MQKRESAGINFFKWVFIVLVLGVCLYFVLGELFLPADVPVNGYGCEEFLAEWTWVKQDGTRVPIEIPGKCNVGRNEMVTIETVLPDNLEINTCLCFRSSKQDMEIYVDGTLRQQYSTKDMRLFGKTSAVAYVFLELEPTDGGKTLTLKTQTDSSYSGIFYRVYYGDKMGIWQYFFKQYGAELIIAFLTLVLGIISIIVSIVLHLCYHRKVELEYLGWGVFLAAVWLIANSMFRQLLFPNISIINDLTFYMIMMLPFPFVLYMNGIQNQRYQKLYVLAGTISVADFAVCTILHVTNRKDFTDTIVFMAAVCFLSILLMGITIMIDIRKGYIREYRLAAIGILGASLAASVQIIMYFRRATLFNGTIMALGLIFLLMVSVIDTIHGVLHMENEKRQAVLASEAKAKFLANMSHEIRTPINAVLGMDAMILRECKDIQIKEYALDIQNAGRSLLALINDILDFSKIESGKLEIIPAEYDFSSMIHDILNMVSIKVRDKDLEMNVFVDQTLPSRLFGDEIRIRQVLINILNNAVKYTHEGSITFTVNGRLQENKVILDFSVEDTGIGIKEEDISKLFTAFERIEEERNRNIEGTGLGMNITVQLLEMMESQLKVESVYGKGSKFSFELEQQIVDREPIGNLEERIRQQTIEYTYDVSFTAPKARILVVDDNGVNRKVFSNLLKETKVKIHEAGSGMECLEKAFQEHYDIIFLDHMMPEMDGVETLHRMKEEKDYPCKDTPVIALTANAISGAKEMYLSEGFDDFLPKPIVPEKLERMIRKMLPKDMIILGERQPEQEKETKAAQEKASRSKEKEESVDLPEIDGIDWNYALMHLKDTGVLMETVEDFYRSMDSEADYLEGYYKELFSNDDGDGKGSVEGMLNQQILDLYRIKVHAMKSSAALIGAVGLSGIAKVLEYAARDKKGNILEQLTSVFLEEWRGYKEKLKQCIRKEENRKQVEDYSVILAYLEMLKPAIEDLDIDVSDGIMDELRQYEYPLDIQTFIEQLSVAVTNLDNDEAAILIEKMINHINAVS